MIIKQILPVINIWNVLSWVWRILILMLECKGFSFFMGSYFIRALPAFLMYRVAPLIIFNE